MSLSVLTTRVARTGSRLTIEPSFSNPAYLAELEANSHRPEIQKIIREGIRSKAIRVRSKPGDVFHVRVLPEKGTF